MGAGRDRLFFPATCRRFRGDGLIGGAGVRGLCNFGASFSFMFQQLFNAHSVRSLVRVLALVLLLLVVVNIFS